MTVDSEHVSVWIERPAREVYDYAVEPTNLPQWAPGLGSTVEEHDGVWWADSPMGRVSFRFVPRNDLGVLDHDVTLPSGDTVTNPVRVLAFGDASEVVFTLRHLDGVSDADFARDVEAVTRDLAKLKAVLEQQ